MFLSASLQAVYALSPDRPLEPEIDPEADIRNYQKCLISFYEAEARDSELNSARNRLRITSKRPKINENP